MVKVKELKYKPQELPCCKDCIHLGKGVKYCVRVKKCFDILIHNDLVEVEKYPKDNIPLTPKEIREVLTDMYTNLPDSDDELIKTARRVTTTKKATTARRSPTRRWQW